MAIGRGFISGCWKGSPEVGKSGSRKVRKYKVNKFQASNLDSGYINAELSVGYNLWNFRVRLPDFGLADFRTCGLQTFQLNYTPHDHRRNFKTILEPR